MSEELNLSDVDFFEEGSIEEKKEEAKIEPQIETKEKPKETLKKKKIETEKKIKRKRKPKQEESKIDDSKSFQRVLELARIGIYHEFSRKNLLRAFINKSSGLKMVNLNWYFPTEDPMTIKKEIRDLQDKKYLKRNPSNGWIKITNKGLNLFKTL